jgi:nucleoside-diphosphate-sugar epimerase
MKVLVTGGGGFLGSWVCRLLQARGDTAIGLQRSHSSILQALGVQQAQGDILDIDTLQQAAQGCDAVIHTAGLAGPWGAEDRYHAINVTGTENVIKACRAVGIRRLVFSSSPSVAHGGGDIEGGDERLPYPASFKAAYPRTKALAEQAVMSANGAALHSVSLRPHLVWGPGDNHLLPRLIERARQGAVRLPGAAKLIDTVYVENAAMAHLQALDALDSNPACHGQTYFISNDEPWPQARIIEALLEASGEPANTRAMPALLAHVAGALCEALWHVTKRPGEPPVTRWSAEQLATAHWYDISAAKRDLGYRPVVTMQECLRRLANWQGNGAAGRYQPKP